jgi:hypothetical protein
VDESLEQLVASRARRRILTSGRPLAVAGPLVAFLLLVVSPTVVSPTAAYTRPVPGGFGDPLRRPQWSGWSIMPPSERPVFDVPIDRQPPVIVASASSGVGLYAIGDPVRVDFTCTDSGSGIRTCPAQAILDTSFPGYHGVLFFAEDLAGNVASTTVVYIVVPRRGTPMMTCPPWGLAWV